MKPYNIPYVGLAIGKHTFHFDLHSKFFEDFDYNEILSSKIKIEVLLEKSEVMIVSNINAFGQIEIECSRCREPFFYDINIRDKVIFKYTDEEFDEETIIGLPPSEYELKMTIPIFQMIVVNLPISFNHKNQNDCNQDMIGFLSKYSVIRKSDEEPIEYSMWEKLKQIKTNKK